MSEGKNIVSGPFASPVKFVLGAWVLFVLAWFFCLKFLSGRAEGGLDSIMAGPMDIRLVLFFVTVFGAAIGLVSGLAVAKQKGKGFVDLLTDGFLSSLAGVCGSWVNWTWAFMFVVWSIVLAVPVAVKAVMEMHWPGMAAFFVFFSHGPLNAQSLTYEGAFTVYWAGGAVAALVFLFLFHQTIFEGFNPVLKKTTFLTAFAVLVAVGVLAIIAPQIGFSLMGILLVGGISTGPLVCIHDCLWCGNGHGASLSSKGQPKAA